MSDSENNRKSVSQAQEQLQLIDQHQNFSPRLQYFLADVWKLKHLGLDYKIVAIFGSQSSGKSTLLNGLFGTHFDVMKNDIREQTTRGIWLSKAKEMPFLILDVEGTDGRERGEDQDFERKSALFSLAIAQVLIINMWEHSVGLYNGANMGLLKTVFEVNLQLFQKKGSPKTMLLFVIRDFLHVTPLKSLEETITYDLNTIWTSLAKPSYCEESSFLDFFDVQFYALPHKILQPEKFVFELQVLSKRFHATSGSEYIFSKDLTKIVPVDGFYTYASGIWETIRTNRDLDLPTQQELLAQFRCDEIGSEVYSEFIRKAKEMAIVLESGKLIDEFGKVFEQLRSASLALFCKEASRYSSHIVSKKHSELQEKLNAALQVVYTGQLRNLYRKCAQLFLSALVEHAKTSPNEFAANVHSARTESTQAFLVGAKSALLRDTNWSYEEPLLELHEFIAEKSGILRKEGIDKATNSSLDAWQASMDEPLEEVFSETRASQWEDVGRLFLAFCTSLLDELRLSIKGYDSDEMEWEKIMNAFLNGSWERICRKIKEEISDASMLLKLRRLFDLSFHYDKVHGLPIIWKSGDDVDRHYKQSLAKMTDYLELCSSWKNVSKSMSSMTDFARISAALFKCQSFETMTKDSPTISLISDQRKKHLRNIASREFEGIYLQAKKSLLVTSYKIPSWFYILLIILGWNELMTILSSPVYLVLFILFAIVAYVLHVLRLIPVVESAFWTGVYQVKQLFFNSFADEYFAHATLPDRKSHSSTTTPKDAETREASKSD